MEVTLLPMTVVLWSLATSSGGPLTTSPIPADPVASTADSGLWAWVDAETGRLVERDPKAELVAAGRQFDDFLDDPHEGLFEQILPDGKVLVLHPDRFRSILYLETGADGTVRMTHDPASTDFTKPSQPSKPIAHDEEDPE